MGGGVGLSLESGTVIEALIHEIKEAFGGFEASGEALESDIEPWSELGAAGFRARLPGAMVRVLHGAEGRGLRWWLTLPLSGDEEIYLAKWALLDARQRACVGRFLFNMAEGSRAEGRHDEASLWEEAYESYWEPHVEQRP